MRRQGSFHWKRPVHREMAELIAWFSVLVHARYRRKPSLGREARQVLRQHGVTVTFWPDGEGVKHG